jgi:HK97 family phage prohead protease
MTTDHAVLRREVSVGLVKEGDGRTLVSRLVPYNEVATVSDDGGMTHYKEAFAPQAFNAQMNSPHRAKVFLNYRHGQSLQDQIGHARELRDLEDGLHGDLRVLEHPDGDKALAFVHDEALDKLSIEFRPERSEMIDGVLWRTKATLLGVALCPEGAYSGAGVLAVRSAPVVPEVELIPAFDPELAASLAALGVAVPDPLRPAA